MFSVLPYKFASTPKKNNSTGEILPAFYFIEARPRSGADDIASTRYTYKMRKEFAIYPELAADDLFFYYPGDTDLSFQIIKVDESRNLHYWKSLP